MAKTVKKSAEEASGLFHNIMAASVKGNPAPKPKEKLVKEHRKSFSKKECDEIRAVLEKKLITPSEGQKSLRENGLRRKYKFYISDFANKIPFTKDDFDEAIKEGRIICNR